MEILIDIVCSNCGKGELKLIEKEHSLCKECIIEIFGQAFANQVLNLKKG